MKTLINKLNYNFNYENINNDFAIVKFQTSDQYIKYGAAILDNKDICAKSIAFDKGPVFYALFKKGDEKQLRFIDLKDPTISFSTVDPMSVPDHLLTRLFINFLNNFDKSSFNNLGGALYIIHKIVYGGQTIEALKLTVTREFVIEIAATKFVQIKTAYNKVPMYTFSNKNKSFKRIYEFNDKDSIYIKEGYESKNKLNDKKVKRTVVHFLDIVNKTGKAVVMYDVINKVNKSYSNYISLHFEEIEILNNLNSLNKEFMDKTIELYNELPCYILNMSNTIEDEYGFTKIKECIENYTGCNIRKVSKIKEDGINLVYIHDNEYYDNNKIEDPYKSLSLNIPIQRFTVENHKEYIDEDGKPLAALKTIMKESIIKHDVFVTNKISFDDWTKYKFENDWIFGISKQIEDSDNTEYYFITIHPDGKFECSKFVNTLFNLDEYELYRQALAGSNGKSVLVKDDNGNINIIEQTNLFTLPNNDFYFTNDIGRGKSDRETYYPGLLNINYYEIDGVNYYNVGTFGTSMQSTIPRASHLYRINQINNSKNIVKNLLELMGVSFVKYNAFTVIPYPIKYLREFAKID